MAMVKVKKKLLPLPAASEAQLVASITRSSFFEFVREFWDVVIPEKPIWNWHIKYLCDTFQRAAERVFTNVPKRRDVVVNISPGSTKSTIASVMFPAWVWARMPSARCICGSYTQPLSHDLSVKSRDVVRSDKYRACFPHIQLREDQATKSHWQNTKGGARYACTVGGSVTGMHGHFLIIDDPLDPNGARSEEEIKNTNHWMSETLPTRKVDKEVSVTFLIMQRLHQVDPTGTLLEKRRGTIHHICLPASLENNVRPRRLRGYYKDGLMDPVRLPKHVLEEARADLGEFGYSGQYRQDPVPLGGGMFKPGRLVIEEGPPTGHGVWRWRVRYWDKAGVADGGDWTVGALLGRDKDDRYWILDIVRGQWASDEREKIIRQTAVLDGHSVFVYVEQEPGSGGLQSAEGTARNLAGYHVRLDRPTGDKATRADPFSVQVNVGNVSIIRAEWNAPYIDEMRYFPLSKHDDQIDASSGAFAVLAKNRIKVGAL